MSKNANVSIYESKDHSYLYLFVNPNKKGDKNYLFSIDKNYGGINSASLPKIDLDIDFNKSNFKKKHTDEYLIGAYYQNRELIICTAKTQKKSSQLHFPTVNLCNYNVYRIDEILFYNVSKDKVQQKVVRPDLYFSPEIDLTGEFPNFEPIKEYKKILDNNNKFCWNKELIRPFSKFTGTPCIVVLQGNIDVVVNDEPEIIYISKFIQNNSFDFNIDQETDDNLLLKERECRCELIFPPLGTFQQTSHTWTMVKTKKQLKRDNEEEEQIEKELRIFFNESQMEVILFNIQDIFSNVDQFKDFQLFRDKRASKILCLFDHFYSNSQKKQNKAFYLIGNDLLQLVNASLLYSLCFCCDFRDFSSSNMRLFSEGTNSRKEIPIKESLLYFLSKCIYKTANVMNDGRIIPWSVIKKEDVQQPFYKKHEDYFTFMKRHKSEKFLLDPLHVLSSFFKPSAVDKLIKYKSHFQDDFVVSQILIHLRHRDQLSSVIEMNISFDEDTHNHHMFCHSVLLPNPPPNTEETFTLSLSKISSSSLLYPVDFKCFQKTRFVTFNFKLQNEIELKAFEQIIRNDDIRFIVKRPVSKSSHYEVVNNMQENQFSQFFDSFLNDSETPVVSKVSNFEAKRIKKGVSDFSKCMYLIRRRVSPVLFDFRSIVNRRINQSNKCPFCDSKLPSPPTHFYEINRACSLFISRTTANSKNSFAVCENCHRKYIENNGFYSDKSANEFDNGMILSFIRENEKNMININEYEDRNVIKLPYKFDRKELKTEISQNVSVYKYSMNNLSKDEVQSLFGGSSRIKITDEFSILFFFQHQVIVNSISFVDEPKGSLFLEINDPKHGRLRTIKENKVPFENPISPQSLELVFIRKSKDEDDEAYLTGVKIFGSFTLPRNDFKPTTNAAASTNERAKSFIDCKSQFDDKFNSVQTISHSGNVRGYRVQIKRGQKLTTIVVAFYLKDNFIGKHFILLPDKEYNENKIFDFPAEFNKEHDCVKIFYLDRRICESVNIKIDTEKK